MSHKVILSLSDITCKTKDNFEHDSYQCHPDNVYVVVGKFFISKMFLRLKTDIILIYIDFRKYIGLVRYRRMVGGSGSSESRNRNQTVFNVINKL